MTFGCKAWNFSQKSAMQMWQMVTDCCEQSERAQMGSSKSRLKWIGCGSQHWTQILTDVMLLLFETKTQIWASWRWADLQWSSRKSGTVHECARDCKKTCKKIVKSCWIQDNQTCITVLPCQAKICKPRDQRKRFNILGLRITFWQSWMTSRQQVSLSHTSVRLYHLLHLPL